MAYQPISQHARIEARLSEIQQHILARFGAACDTGLGRPLPLSPPQLRFTSVQSALYPRRAHSPGFRALRHALQVRCVHLHDASDLQSMLHAALNRLVLAIAGDASAETC
ncbi:uncharacterized protein L969DRAFT_85687 [Mixia osmundae IAM 14324]|nr:uncharacterized protein L969DRAFT_85687 [Mixia osmundae IAM 14324]KEI40514.1 hypothetical protein L969DRAFT_85687 [Mixia osmundae IAM 14324]